MLPGMSTQPGELHCVRPTTGIKLRSPEGAKRPRASSASMAEFGCAHRRVPPCSGLVHLGDLRVASRSPAALPVHGAIRRGLQRPLPWAKPTRQRGTTLRICNSPSVIPSRSACRTFGVTSPGPALQGQLPLHPFTQRSSRRRACNDRCLGRSQQGSEELLSSLLPVSCNVRALPRPSAIPAPFRCRALGATLSNSTVQRRRPRTMRTRHLSNTPRLATDRCLGRSQQGSEELLSRSDARRLRWRSHAVGAHEFVQMVALVTNDPRNSGAPPP
jgi:hypothetical protein